MRLNEFLGIKYPIIQGGMANIATGAFAAAVSNAGGLGLIASGGMNANQLREEIINCRKLTDKTFGVNLMLMNPDAENIANMLAEEKVDVITTGAGSPEKYVDMWKKSGSKVIPVVSSVALAKKMEKIGVDAVIAEGGESGGHVGEMTTMTLVPMVVDALSIPVIAAGGIADGRQLVAALSLGAIGVQVGTCLLVSEECPIHDNYKQAVIKAKDNGTAVTGRSAGAPVRIIKNQLSREYLKLEAEGTSRDELEQFTLGSLRRAVFDGDTKMGSLMAGQVCGMLNEIKPVAVILDELYNGAKEELRKLAEEAL
ncbi:MAG: nitronate monooxygenase [Lachnospiraceae bacterium]|nr:nitronate monooxygenase [Lachnospiraceae bacterium]